MKYILILIAFIFVHSVQAEISMDEFYAVYSSNKRADIESYLNYINKDENNSNSVKYKAALLMRLSDFERDAKTKIATFKEGVLLLESEIKNNPGNIELYFLRFTIQENAPKVLKYNKNIADDKSKIISEFQILNPILKKHIKNYAKLSTALMIEDLKG